MKWFLIIIVVVCVATLLAYLVMAVQSQQQPDTIGLQQGLLRPCPDSPNCVCSESHSQTSAEHAISPMRLNDDVWQGLKTIIVEMGGSIEQDDGDYLHATFSSALFHFVDDVELRRDIDHDLIQIRSASRAGHSDFGVNRKRVEQIVHAANVTFYRPTRPLDRR